ncbi:MAG TPA: MBL fold metallo-hydrolase [Clostridia bacterium]
MSFNICALASGSKGNAALISTDKTKILIDAGISCRAVQQKLKAIGHKPEEIDAVLITHCHWDHISGIKSLVNKYNLTVYTYYRNYDCLASYIGSGKNIVELDGNDFFINEITVSPFELSHDVHCFGYSFYCRGKKITVMTDMGKVTDCVKNSAKDSDILMIESNHDVQKLLSNEKYSASLKQRIISDQGHLSNELCADALTELITQSGRQVMLAHLSQENNTPELAYTITANALKSRGILAGKDVKISVASQYEISEILSAV